MPNEKIVLHVGSRPWSAQPEPFNPEPDTKQKWTTAEFGFSSFAHGWYEKEKNGYCYTFAETSDRDAQGILIYRLVRRVPVRNGNHGFVPRELVRVVATTSTYHNHQGSVISTETNWVRVRIGERAIWFRTYEVVQAEYERDCAKKIIEDCQRCYNNAMAEVETLKSQRRGLLDLVRAELEDLTGDNDIRLLPPAQKIVAEYKAIRAERDEACARAARLVEYMKILRDGIDTNNIYCRPVPVPSSWRYVVDQALQETDSRAWLQSKVDAATNELNARAARLAEALRKLRQYIIDVSHFSGGTRILWPDQIQSIDASLASTDSRAWLDEQIAAELESLHNRIDENALNLREALVIVSQRIAELRRKEDE